VTSVLLAVIFFSDREELSLARHLMVIADIAVSSALVLMKILPGVPGHFTVYEYAALALWCAAGLGFNLETGKRRKLENRN
jgi:hypothetical protein